MWEGGEEFVEVLAPGAFSRSLSSGDHIVALWSHDMAKPLASTRNDNLILKEDEKGLWFSMSLERMDAMMLAAARDGDVQMSFGMFIRDRDWSRREDGTRVRTITDLDLFEISPVVFPAFPATEAAVRCFEKWSADHSEVEDIEEMRVDHTVQLAQIRLKKARLKSKLA